MNCSIYENRLVLKHWYDTSVDTGTHWGTFGSGRTFWMRAYDTPSLFG